jgi:DNA-binding CsgD family transcriptional regulator
MSISLLTKSEKSLIDWLCLGKSIPEAALLLDKSPHTLKNQLRSVYEKLDICSRAQLAQKYMPATLIAESNRSLIQTNL